MKIRPPILLNEKIFIMRLQSCIGPCDNLIAFLRLNGFFRAPCSVGHHLAIDGGLCHHSLSVMYFALCLKQRYNLPISEVSIIKCSLLHDICKMFMYEKVGLHWEYKDKDKSKYHGEESLRLLEPFVDLTEQEKEMVRWHMGPYTDYFDGHTVGDFLNWSKDKTNKNINAALFLYFCDHFSSMFLEE